MNRTLSIAKGKGSIGHNLREFTAENIDPDRSQFNTCFVHENIHSVYHKLFDSVLEEYNAKQKRKDRKIPDYYEKIRTSKQEKLFYEIIVQVGNYEDMSAIDENGKIAEEILKKYMTDFRERNPTLYVFSAHLHMDEATPHLHIDFVPYTSGNKRGLETKNTLKGALEKLGFTGGTRGDTELNQWQNAEKEKLAEIMLEHGIRWEKKGSTKEHLPVLDYKKEMRSQEVAQLEEKIENLQSELHTGLSEMKEIQVKKTKIQSIDDISEKPTMLDASKIVVPKVEFDEIKALAKKQIAGDKKEKKLALDNKKLQAENQKLTQEVHAQKAELSEFKSVRNQLKTVSAEAELSNVKKMLNKVLDFVEKLGLKAQLERFLSQKIDKSR